MKREAVEDAIEVMKKYDAAKTGDQWRLLEIADNLADATEKLLRAASERDPEIADLVDSFLASRV